MNAALRIRLLIVDSHPIVRAGLVAVLSSQPDMEVVGQAGTGREALDFQVKAKPDVTLMELALPGMSGLEALRQMRQRRNDAKIVILTSREGDEEIRQALLAGAGTYILKGMAPEVILQGIRQVHLGKVYLPAEISRAVGRRFTEEELSRRERQVLSLLASGHSNRMIAQELGVMESTVKCHVGVILSRLGAEDRTQAVLIALRRGFVHLQMMQK